MLFYAYSDRVCRHEVERSQHVWDVKHPLSRSPIRQIVPMGQERRPRGRGAGGTVGDTIDNDAFFAGVENGKAASAGADGAG